MEKISVDCPNCNSTLKAPPEFAGKVATCPDCGTKVRVPIGPSSPQGTAPQSTAPAGPPKRKPPGAAPAVAADEFGVDTEAGDDPFAAAPAGSSVRGRRKKKPSVDPKMIAIGVAALAVVAVAVWFFTMRGAGAAMNYMPDGTAVVGVVHYADIMDSKFVKTVREKFPQLKDARKQYTKDFGDLIKKVDRITFGGNPDKEEMLAYVELKSSTSVDEIMDEISNAKFKKPKTVGGHKIYAEREGKGNKDFCLLDSRTVLVGKAKLIEDVLKRDGEPKLAKGMRSVLAKADMSKSVCVAMSLKAMKGGPGGGMAGGEAVETAMKKAEAAIFTVDVGSDLDFNLSLTFDDKDDAKDVKKKIAEGIESIKGNFLMKMLGKAGKQLMEGIDVKSSGEKVTIVGSISVDTIEKIADKLKKGGGGMPFRS